MVNWTALDVILKCAAVFANIVHLSAGAYALDCCFTMIYDWEIITGKRRWKWTMPLYFLCKWIMFFACVAMILVLNIDKPINCQALYTFAQFAGNTAIGSASTLLMLRTIAIWNRNLWVTIPLVILSLGQWGILFHGMTTVRSQFAGTCVLVTTGDNNNLFLNLLYLYTMFIDLVVLIVSTVGLLMTPGRSSLWKLLFRDGIIFFLMAFFSNAISAVFLLLNLNPAMNLIFSVPAACITASAATRSFIRLSTWAQADVYVHQTTSMGGRATRPGQIGSNGKPDKHNMSVVHFTRTRPMDDDLETGNATRIDNNSEDFDTKPTNTRSVTFTQSNVPGVMITMDTFSSVVDTTQNGKGPQRSKSINSARSSLEFDSAIIDHARREPGSRTHGYGDGKPSAAGAW